jgi:predicted kinase
MGVAGTGKSTLSREILRRLSAVYLDNNHIADAFFPDTRNGVDYEKSRPGFYKILYTITEENLRLGNSVLLDVPHTKEVQRGEWRVFVKRLIGRTGSTMVAIRCRCSENVLRARIRSRGEQRDRWKLEHWDEFLAQQPIDIAIPFPHLDIDTEKNRLRNISTAIKYIMSQVAAYSRPPH